VEEKKRNWNDEGRRGRVEQNHNSGGYKNLFHLFFIVCCFDFHLVGVIWTGRWAGERKERISEVTLYPPLYTHSPSTLMTFSRGELGVFSFGSKNDTNSHL